MALIIASKTRQPEPQETVTTIFSNSIPTKQHEQHEQLKQSGINPIILDKLLYIETSLKSAQPQITEALKTIHRAMLEDPEQVTILTDENRHLFFQGLMKQTGTEIIASGKGKKAASAKNFTVDDFL